MRLLSYHFLRTTTPSPLPMLYTLFLAGLGVAGFVVVFSKLRRETSLDAWVGRLPAKVAEAVRCPLCLGYWLSLGVALVIDTGVRSMLVWRIPDPYATALSLLASWYAIGFAATVWRLSYQLLWKGSLWVTLKADTLHDELHGH